jgi:glyoxylase-like metal-dependent hydrolase (beta-lactamase superfamily II)
MLGMVPDQDFAPPETYEHLKHGQVLDLCGMRFEVRHTPGHTPGHCCFLLEEEGVLFSGDQLFAGSIGRTDLPGGDFDQLVVSMRERVLDLPDDVRVLPGHGPETTIGWERRTNPFRHEWA